LAEETPLITLGWRVMHEQVVSSHARVFETRKRDNVNSAELTIVPHKLAIVYPIGEPLTVPDEQVIETRHVPRVVDNHNSADSEVVLDKPSIEDEFIVDYPIGDLLTVPDKLVTENQYVDDTSINPVKSLNCGSVINDNNADISPKSKRIRKVPVTRTDDFYGNTQTSNPR
jgi:hypothetical protein